MRSELSTARPQHGVPAVLAKRPGSVLNGVWRRGSFATCGREISAFFLEVKHQFNEWHRLSFVGVMLEYLMCREVVLNALEAGVGIEQVLVLRSHQPIQS